MTQRSLTQFTQRCLVVRAQQGALGLQSAEEFCPLSGASQLETTLEWGSRSMQFQLDEARTEIRIEPGVGMRDLYEPWEDLR